MRKLTVSDNPAELHLIRSALEESGIEVELVNEDLAPLLGEVPQNPATLPAIYVVIDEEFERAKRVLAKLKAARATRVLSPGAVKCPLCESEDVAPYSAFGILVVILVILLVFIGLSITGAINTGQAWFLIVALACALMAPVVAYWIYLDRVSDKRQYYCAECGLRWPTRGPAAGAGEESPPENAEVSGS